MSNKDRTHVPESLEGETNKVVYKHLSKQDFGRKLYALMIAKGWRQADLARASDIPKDSISSYVRGQALPTSINLQKLSRTLNQKPEELLPSILESAIDNDLPALDVKVSPNAPGKAWLRVNQLVSTRTAVKIQQLLLDDAPTDTK